MASVAIACQGGGSHTAFTAGVLQHVLAHDDHRIVAVSGTSGGAICALLTWYGLHRSGPPEAVRLLEGFWRANSASTVAELLANAWLVGLARLEGQVALPMVSPYTYPEVARATLTDLLGGQVDFDEVARLQQPPTDRRPLLAAGCGGCGHRRAPGVFQLAWRDHPQRHPRLGRRAAAVSRRP